MFRELLTSCLLAFSSTLLLLWILVPVARHIGLVDHPGGRKTHSQPTPLVGGIAIFIAFAFSALTLQVPLSAYRMFFAGGLLLVVVGVLDDLHELSARYHFAAQIAAGLLMTLGGGVVLRDFGHLLLPDQPLTLGVAAVPVTVFGIVGVMNAVNMVDGLDGLATSLVLVTIAALAIIGWVGGDLQAVGVLGVLSAAALAFLLFNLRPSGHALAFMGDAGSLFLGYVLAWFLVQLSQGEHRLMEPVTALWLFALPLVDTVAMMARRILLGRSPFLADREHFHHILLAAGFSPKQTLLLLILLALVAAGLGLIGQFLGIAERWMFLGFLGLFSLHFWTIMRAWRVKRFLARPLLQPDDTPA